VRHQHTNTSVVFHPGVSGSGSGFWVVFNFLINGIGSPLKTSEQIGIFASALLLLLLSMPFVGLYNEASLIYGIPLTLWVLFGTWIGVVAFLFFASRNTKGE
jgi:hypothetical protein